MAVLCNDVKIVYSTVAVATGQLYGKKMEHAV